AGTPVQNGTLVTFTTTLGTIEPREARTNNGQVTAQFLTGNQSGTAKVGAVSGGAKATEVEIKVGAAAADALTLSVAPGSNATVPSTGGTVQLVAVVLDASGNRLPGVPVTFTNSAGTLSLNSVITDSNGEARTVLTTSRESVVSATAGGKKAPDLTVKV